MRLIDADAAADKIMRETETHADEIGAGGVALMIGFARALRDTTDFPTVEDADGATCKLDGVRVWNPARGCKYRAAKKPTNGDRIRSMIDDEDLLYAIGTNCNRCAYAEGRNGMVCGEHCWEGNMEWLESEVQNDDE